MTDEKLAEYYTEFYGFGSDFNNITSQEANQAIEQACLAALKVGRQKWHKVADGDLPKYGYQVLSDKGVPVIYNHDTHSWFEYSPNADNIELRKWEEPIAWCEKPKYEED